MSPRAGTLLKNLRLSTTDGFAAVPICYLSLPGNFIVAALLVGCFNLSPVVYGVIGSMPYWGNFAQALVLPFFSRRLSSKAAALWPIGLQLACWTALTVALGFLPEGRPGESKWWFVGFFAVAALSNAMATVGWTAWVQEWVPERLRAGYFGLRNRLVQIAQIVYLLLVAWLLRSAGGTVRVFQIVLGAAVFLRVFSFWAQAATRAGKGAAAREAAAGSWREQLEAIGRTGPFKWFIAYGAVWGFAANFFGPFSPVFMMEQLGCSASKVSFLMVLTSVGGALSYQAWGTLANRFGNKPVMLFTMIPWQLSNFGWSILTPQNAWLLYGMYAFGGIMNAGFTLTLFNIQLKLIPPAAKTLAISLNLAITALATAVAPILGGRVLQAMLGGAGAAGGAGAISPLAAYHALALVQPVLALLGCLLLVRVREVNARPLASVVGAMRNIRTLSAMLGLGFFVNHIFYRQPKK